MARYDYKCDDCGIVEEVSHGMLESPDIKCKCGGSMHKMVNLSCRPILPTQVNLDDL